MYMHERVNGRERLSTELFLSEALGGPDVVGPF